VLVLRPSIGMVNYFERAYPVLQRQVCNVLVALGMSGDNSVALGLKDSTWAR
jgi:hypothetical protein